MKQETLDAMIDKHEAFLENRGGGVPLDIEGQDLAELDIGGRQLKGARLAECNMRDMGGANCNLERADLTGSFLSGSNFQNADFNSAYLEGCKLKYCDMAGADFTRAKMSGADLTEADLEECIMSHADMQGVIAKKAFFKNSTMVEVDLRKANLESANLKKVDMMRCDLEGANIEDTEFDGADASGAVSLVYDIATEQNKPVEMLSFAQKAQFRSPRSLYEKLPKAMGMKKVEKSRLDFIKGPVWTITPNPGARRRARARALPRTFRWSRSKGRKPCGNC